MSEERQIIQQFAEHSPVGYKLNTHIAFSYPVRRVQLSLLVDKQPDASLLKMYSVMLKTIQSGISTKNEFFSFLGLADADEFIMKELAYLQDKGYLLLSAERWNVTDNGVKFIENTSILRVEEQEEYEFLVDAVNGELISCLEIHTERKVFDKEVKRKITFSSKNPELIRDKAKELADLYKKDSKNKAYLIDYSEKNILRDHDEWCNYWLIEYVPEQTDYSEISKFEVRYYQSLRLNKNLTIRFNADISLAEFMK